jgi:hypothetical protein
MLAGRLLCFQRAIHPFPDGILEKSGAFRAEAALAQSCGQDNLSVFGGVLFPGAVDLDKLPDQPDIFFLLSVNIFHVRDNPLF